MASTKSPEQKVILVGDFGVGKSSLFRRYMCDTFINSSDRKATLGLDHYSKTFEVNGRNMKLLLFDRRYGENCICHEQLLQIC